MIALVEIPIPQDIEGREQAGREVLRLLELLTDIAMRQAPTPDLYRSGVRYKGEGNGVQRFRLPYDTHAQGVGDCKQLVVWRLAELRRAGEHATPAIMWERRPGGWRAHARVRRASGELEDPSMERGMGNGRKGRRKR